MIGFSVAISGNGNIIAVGAPGYNGTRGAVLIYSNNNGIITYTGRVDPTSASVGDYAGQFVKLNEDGTVLAIGAPLASGNSGKVWIYNNSFTNSQIISPPPSAIGLAYFGDTITMSLDGKKIFVSSKIAYTGGINCRSYSYNYNSTTSSWSLGFFYQVSVTTSFPINSVDFDIKASEKGNYLVVSCPNDNNTSGKVFILNINNDSFYQTILYPESGESGFGYKVAISGDAKTIYISSASNDSNEGQIWTYRQSEIFDTTWIRVLQPFRGSNDIGQPQQGFSIACNFNGSTLISGGPFDNNNKGASWSFI